MSNDLTTLERTGVLNGSPELPLAARIAPQPTRELPRGIGTGDQPLAARPPADSHARSILKAATWRAGGLCLTVAVAWAVTGRADLAASIGLADTVLKLGAYYVHERAWLKVRFGRPRLPDYEI